MPKSSRRQKVLLERELKKVVDNEIYTKDEEGNYRLQGTIKLPDFQYSAVKVNYEKLREVIKPKTLREILSKD